jgi:uncharacterized protein (TIGR03546 family)
MIFWIVKLVSSIRRAIAGRKYPHQLAWAVALGLLLGIVPHGNLLAFGLVVLVLSLKINHAMAGLTAVCATFLAVKLDPYSHELGNFVLTHPQLEQTSQLAWNLPLMPWTDLNNTIVMGSFLIGLTAVVPVFLVTYPLFRLVAPPNDEAAESGAKPLVKSSPHHQSNPHQVVLIDHGHTVPTGPKRAPQEKTDAHSKESHSSALLQDSRDASKGVSTEPVDFEEVESEPTAEPQVAVETRIDVIRMTDHYGTKTEYVANEAEKEDSEPMDEALNYLLRQLRDSQQRKAA